MEPIIKEKETIYADGYGGNGGGSNLRSKANAGVTLGIIGTVLGAAAIAKQGGVGGILGGGVATPTPDGPVNNFYGAFAPSSFCAYSKECDDVLALTNAFWAQKVDTMKSAAAAREVDVNEKFGLYISNRNNIDSVQNRINSELFSLYKYTRDKDDETNARIANLESQVAVNTAVRPYQDQLLICKINEVAKDAAYNLARRTCRMVEGVNVLPLTPEVTGVYSQNCCTRIPAPAAAAETPAAGA